jgi:NAD(P)-dependent dehydrogenase (short-subunit alcohol dehydrogenase family)
VAESSSQFFRDVNIVVVGGSAGLGRQYCLDLGKAGARVVVAARSEAAIAVVEEICAAGGIATACQADARQGDRIVETALAAYGRIDGMIINAGITRDRSFGKMSSDDWTEVLSVHVDGAFSCARAVWAPMSEQRHGHILLTTSGAGMHGNFGQSNYAAAKGAIIGLTRSLALEGASRNIRVNAIAPMALTGMTERVFDAELRAALKPEHVSPVALALVHPSSTETGAIIETGGGWVGKMRWERSKGVRLPDMSAESLLAHWNDASRFDEEADHPQTTTDSLNAALGRRSNSKDDKQG